MTEVERRLIERCASNVDYIDKLCTSEHIAKAVLRATGISLSALAALAEKRWQAVPKEATAAMAYASETTRISCTREEWWEAVLAAAPSEPEAEDAAR